MSTRPQETAVPQQPQQQQQEASSRTPSKNVERINTNAFLTLVVNAMDIRTFCDILCIRVCSDNGYQIRGPCPIHGGDNLSAFMIKYKDENGPCFRWDCYTKCGTGGDVINLVMNRLNVGFTDAVFWLARLFHIKMKDMKIVITDQKLLDFIEASRFNNEMKKMRDELAPVKDSPNTDIHINENFVTTCLARRNRFFVDKGYTNEILDKFEIGFCPEYCSPPTWKYSLSGGARMTVPIRDELGNLIGISGRTIKEDSNHVPDKYKNLPGTKRRITLYGIDKAMPFIAEKKSIILVEGYSDVWKSWMFGKKNIVAVMGTILTNRQKKFILSNVNTAAICMDNDKGGNNAAERITEQLKDYVTLYRVTLPKGKDVGDISRDEYYLSLRNAKKIT
jgi:DNA primase